MGVVRAALALAAIGLSMLLVAAREPGPPPAPPASAVGTVLPTRTVSTGRTATTEPGPPAPSAQPGTDAGTGPGTDPGTGSGTGPGTGSRVARPGVGLPRSRPVELVIPRIGVRTGLMELGLAADGTVQVPPLGRDAPAGWYRPLASPGEVGPAVLLGHVDSAADGPAVFYRLGLLRPGDSVIVTRADHLTVRFTVTGVVAVPKQDFPTDAVYGPVDRPVLRLVTCGGRFDPARHSYRDNVVVFAELAR